MAGHPVSSALQVDLRVEGRVSAALRADEGETIAVIGPNGAGKSTLVRAIAGLAPAHGSATLDGVDLLSQPIRARRIGLVFQDRLLFPHLSALENVAFGPRSRGESRRVATERAKLLLDRFGIGDLAARRPAELSGGQAQRVAIARALATEPDLLLMDEPFAGLDVGVAMSLRLEMAQHLAAFDGVTLLVTHDALDARALADRVLVLEGGRVAQEGTFQEVAARPATEHVARLVGVNLVRSGAQMLTFTPRDVTVALSPPAGSARLRWHGRITSAQPHGDAVRLLVHSEPPLLADVTPQAVIELSLAPGCEVWLSVKSTAADRYDAGAAADSMRP